MKKKMEDLYLGSKDGQTICILLGREGHMGDAIEAAGELFGGKWRQATTLNTSNGMSRKLATNPNNGVFCLELVSGKPKFPEKASPRSFWKAPVKNTRTDTEDSRSLTRTRIIGILLIVGALALSVAVYLFRVFLINIQHP